MSESGLLALQFWIIIIFILISPYLRFYRERYQVIGNIDNTSSNLN